ncbi:MAG: TonB-dependent receptor plug domain-containing protein, partial [Burkholderiaceae bacterium]|nr:TonB-dependent receptor plug domain-containing protein [Burkholderiaceae bacterium]
MTPELSQKMSTRAVQAALATMCAGMSMAAWADPADTAPSAPQVITVSSTREAKAAEGSPSQVSLDAIQPQSIVGQRMIEENSFAGSNYADIVNWTPSVFSIDPNGAGLMESQSLTIRGFQDGQYNVTFDGIPWGDSNDFTHHSTVYFMPQDLGRISVDRGPGDATTIGNATFGGTIALNSKDTLATRQGLVYGSYGSWSTGLLGVEYNSGTLSSFGDSRIYVSLKGLHSDGFLTDSAQNRENFFFKMDTPLAPATTLTVAAMYNHTLQNVPNGSTPQQQAQYGYNFGLISDNQSESNKPWNYDWLTTDFEYVGFKTRQDTWTFDNKLYTYAYYHYGYYGMNTGSVTAAQTGIDDQNLNSSPNGTVIAQGDVPGIRMHNNYRSVGDLFRASDRLGPGLLETGVWFDYQRDNRFQQDIDWTLGGIPFGGESNGGSVQRSMENTLTTFQPYVQYTWNVTSQFSVTPGVKYDSFRRTIDAPVNQKTEVPYSGSATWN